MWGQANFISHTHFKWLGFRNDQFAKINLSGDFTTLITVALVLEYEAVCGHAAQRAVSGLSGEEVRTFITALCGIGERVNVWFLWRPLLRDPADDMVLEAAINGRADALVTFNRRDFGDEPRRFGVAVLSPQEALRRIKT